MKNVELRYDLIRFLRVESHTRENKPEDPGYVVSEADVQAVLDLASGTTSLARRAS
jgi:hypothetical protein